MCLRKMAGVTVVFVFFGKLVRPGFRGVRQGVVVH